MMGDRYVDAPVLWPFFGLVVVSCMSLSIDRGCFAVRDARCVGL